jgi:hypothetical protein
MNNKIYQTSNKNESPNAFMFPMVSGMLPVIFLLFPSQISFRLESFVISDGSVPEILLLLAWKYSNSPSWPISEAMEWLKLFLCILLWALVAW